VYHLRNFCLFPPAKFVHTQLCCRTVNTLNRYVTKRPIRYAKQANREHSLWLVGRGWTHCSRASFHNLSLSTITPYKTRPPLPQPCRCPQLLHRWSANLQVGLRCPSFPAWAHHPAACKCICVLCVYVYMCVFVYMWDSSKRSFNVPFIYVKYIFRRVHCVDFSVQHRTIWVIHHRTHVHWCF
jgi:hypothetical protein